MSNFRPGSTKHTSACKECLDERAFNKKYPNTICQCCKKHRKIDTNNNCKKCNTSQGIRRCKYCNLFLPIKGSFKDRSTQCYSCVKIKAKTPPITEKECQCCKKTQTIELFLKSTGYASGISNICKKCNNNRWKQKLLKKPLTQEQKHKISKRVQKYTKERYHSDPRFKIRRLITSRITRVLNGTAKSGKTLELLGCSREFLFDHLKTLFWPGMTWDNMGKDGWHIDHIVPTHLFNLTSPEEQRKCFNYTNLQPLWANDNLTKQGRTDWTPEESAHLLPPRLLAQRAA
jgi:hypothetical protein